MTDSYTPSAAEVRDAATDAAMVTDAEFDRWLTEHDAEVRADALTEAAEAFWRREDWSDPSDRELAYNALYDRADAIREGDA